MSDIRLFCRESGEGFPLILLHGNGESSDYFESQIPAFSRIRHVYAPDTRGHGRSPMGSSPFTISQFADDLLAFMDERGIEKADVLGFSDGGSIALIFALRYPERLSKLIVDGANLYPSGMKNSVWREIRRRCRKFDADPSMAYEAKLYHLMTDKPDIKPWELRKIKVPALVVAGTDDLIKERHTRLIARNIPGAVLRIIPGGHAVAAENPDRFNETVIGFLEGRPDSN